MHSTPSTGLAAGHPVNVCRSVSTEEQQDTHFLARTCALLDVCQFPHGELLGVVGLAGVAGSRADAPIAQPSQVRDAQLLAAAVGPELPADSLVELLRKGLERRTGVRRRPEPEHQYCLHPSIKAMWAAPSPGPARGNLA